VQEEPKSSRECALIAARAADERKATDIVVINVGDMVDVTDYFVIVTAANVPQVNAVLDNIEEKVRIEGHMKPISREETRDRSWELLDYGDFVINVFQPEAREYYRLETLWSDAPIVDLSEAGIENPEYSERIARLVGRVEEARSEEA
jgi:ribosome-associated protein